MTTASSRSTQTTLIQTATGWPANDEGWTTHEKLRFDGGEETVGGQIGLAACSQVYGPYIDEGETQQLLRTRPANLVGKLARVLVSDASGAISVSGTTYSALWHGQIVGEDWQGDGADGGVVTFQMAELTSLLDQISLHRGYEISTGISTPVDPGMLPPFNDLPGGDRSTSTVSVNGTSVYVHWRGRTTANRWTARQIVDHLLAGHIDVPLPPDFTTRSALTWVLGGQTSALDFEPDRLDLHGMTVLEALNTLISPRYGLTWKLVVSGTTATVTVGTTTASNLTVGSYTLPAASTTATLTDNGTDPFLHGLEINPDHRNVYDAIFVIGAHPRVAITLDWKEDDTGVLQKGWNPADEATWDPAAADGAVAGNALVWRRFILRTNWNGYQLDQSGTDGLRNYLTYTETTSSEYGNGGYDGSRSHLDAGGSPEPAPALRMLRADRNLPLPADDGGSLVSQGEMEPLVIREESASAFTDLSATLALRMDETPLAITLGHSPADVETEIADWFESGVPSPATRLLFTVCLREPRPLQVSWIRPRSEWPRDLPRIRTIHLPDAEQWRVLPGTVTGINAGGTAVTTDATGTTYRDDLPTLKATLALARPYFSEPTYTVTWTDRGQIEYASTYRPGALLTTVTESTGDTTSPNAVITRRHWVPTAYGFDTVYLAATLPPSIEALL